MYQDLTKTELFQISGGQETPAEQLEATVQEAVSDNIGDALEKGISSLKDEHEEIMNKLDQLIEAVGAGAARGQGRGRRMMRGAGSAVAIFSGLHMLCQFLGGCGSEKNSTRTA